MSNRRQFLKRSAAVAFSSVTSGGFINISAKEGNSEFEESTLDTCYTAIDFVTDPDPCELILNASRRKEHAKRSSSVINTETDTTVLYYNQNYPHGSKL